MSSSETSVHTAIDWLEDAQTAEKASERQLRYALGLASTEGITNDVSSPYRPTTLPSDISSFEDINAYFDEANMGPSFTFSTSSERATVMATFQKTSSFPAEDEAVDVPRKSTNASTQDEKIISTANLPTTTAAKEEAGTTSEGVKASTEKLATLGNEEATTPNEDKKVDMEKKWTLEPNKNETNNGTESEELDFDVVNAYKMPLGSFNHYFLIVVASVVAGLILTQLTVLATLLVLMNQPLSRKPTPQELEECEDDDDEDDEDSKYPDKKSKMHKKGKKPQNKTPAGNSKDPGKKPKAGGNKADFVTVDDDNAGQDTGTLMADPTSQGGGGSVENQTQENKTDLRSVK